MNQERVLLLIAGAILTYPDDVRQHRESGAIAKVAKHIVDVTSEDQQIAIEKLKIVRFVAKQRLDEAQSLIERMIAVSGFERKAVGA